MPVDYPVGETGLNLIHEDSAILLLNKPSGLLSVPGRGADKQDCLSVRVQRIYPDALVVHRLDMSTSGLLLMARGIAVQRQLNAAFVAGEVHKRYVAVVAGQLQTPPNSWREIDLPISVDWPHRPLRMVDTLHGKPSLTRARSVSYERTSNTSRVDLEPVTGRTHQLRVHLSTIGHPIVGDALYAPPSVASMSSRLLLHACLLMLVHPLSGRRLEFNCAPDF